MNRHSVNRFLAHHAAHTLEDEQEWYEKIRTDKGSSLHWGIWLITDDGRRLIGVSSRGPGGEHLRAR